MIFGFDWFRHMPARNIELLLTTVTALTGGIFGYSLSYVLWPEVAITGVMLAQGYVLHWQRVELKHLRQALIEARLQR